MNRWHPYNPNPIPGKRVGDCSVRAISKATGQDWDKSYLMLSIYGFEMKNMPSGNCVWGRYLENKGFHRRAIEGYPKSSYTVIDFCEDHPSGTYVLGCDGHVLTVVDGMYYDSWDSGGEIPIYYWERE